MKKRTTVIAIQAVMENKHSAIHKEKVMSGRYIGTHQMQEKFVARKPNIEQRNN